MKNIFLLLSLMAAISCQSQHKTAEKSGETEIVPIDQRPKTINGKPYQEPQALDIEPAQFLELIETDKNFAILDVRTPEEIAEGKLDNALEIDFYAENFEDQLAELPRDVNYYVYCRSGGRSGQTIEKMKNMGFQKSYNVKGGYKAIIEAMNQK